MIRDGRQSDLDRALRYEVAIIGAGPAGISIAMELAGSGIRVALIESGGEEFDPETQELYDGSVTGLEETDLTASRLRFLGGTSNHWGGHCLPLDPIDFERAPSSGLTGWPFSISRLEDAYQRASLYCDLGSFDYSLDAAADVAPDDFLLWNNDTIETALIRQSRPTRFGEKFKKDLASSETVDLWLWTNAVGIEFDADANAKSVTTQTLDGLERIFSTDYVVLACGAVENARFLLANNSRQGKSFGNSGAFLGSCYMDHAVGGAAFLWLDQPSSPKVYWRHDISSKDGVPLHFVWRLRDEILLRQNLSNTQFFLIPLSVDGGDPRLAAANQGWQSLKSIAKWGLGRGRHDFELSAAYCETITNVDAIALDALGLIDREADATRLLLRYETEQLPDRSSYVALTSDLDRLGMPKARLHWSPTETDRDSIVNSAILIGSVCGAEGLGRIELEDHFDRRYWDAASAWHQLGTTRMSVAPSDGVVDPDCRLHGTKNLYVAGGSVMPTGGRANPTLTIVALAIRLADHLKVQVQS